MYLSTGLGDMAVSNTIGSNVFDILVGLGVPWSIQTMAVNYGSEVSEMFSLKNSVPSTQIWLNIRLLLYSGENQQ